MELYPALRVPPPVSENASGPMAPRNVAFALRVS
jgi:hypothetical protein